MAQTVGGQVGPTTAADNTYPPMRLGKGGDVIVSEFHGRFYEQCYRENLFMAGSGATALSANTITLTNSSTPIVGVWNPSTSLVNLVILQVMVTWYINTLTTPASAGPFLFATSVGNAAISTGSTPYNLKTLAQAGSAAKAFNGGTALTGLTNNVVVLGGLDVPSPGILAYGTITAPTATGNSLAGMSGTHNFDGSLIIPPGGVLSIINTTSTTTMSVASRLLWEEVPL